jgi:putative CocE/NonD family hydrolase
MKRFRRVGVLVVAVLVATAVVPGGPAAPAAEPQEATVTRDLVIPLSDGSYLLGDLYQPLDAALPTIVVLTPYKKDDPISPDFSFTEAAAGAGFAALLVDIRGTGRSPGTFCFACEREIEDGVEVVEWAAAQPFSDGNVGLYGFSYSAIVAAHVASRNPPSLKAVVPNSAYSDLYRDLAYPGGIPASEDLGLLLSFFLFFPNARGGTGTPVSEHPGLAAAAATSPATVALEGALRDTYDDFWKERALENKVHGITAPTLWISGWDDIYVRGMPRNFLDSTSADHAALIMGPWGHFAVVDAGIEDVFHRNALEWFDIFLGGEEAARDQRIAAYPKVRLFDLDPASSDEFLVWNGRWRTFETWPDHRDLVLEPCLGGPGPSTAMPWPQQGSLLESCGSAAQVPVISAPIEATGPRSVTHDTDPIGLSDAVDQRLNPAALAFLGPELSEGVTITGPGALELTAIATNTDADWVARIVDVGPDGAKLLAQGRLRASHRAKDPDRGYLWHLHEDPQPLTPGEAYELTIEIWPTSWVVPAGHRIGLLLQTADNAKTLPSHPSPANIVVVGPDANTRLTLPIRTDHGAMVPAP